MEQVKVGVKLQKVSVNCMPTVELLLDSKPGLCPHWLRVVGLNHRSAFLYQAMQAKCFTKV